MGAYVPYIFAGLGGFALGIIFTCRMFYTGAWNYD